MSKELTPLRALKEIGKLKESRCYINTTVEYKMVETTLKEKEQQDSVLKILKEIIGFAQMLPQVKPNKDNVFDIMSAVGINIQRDIENKERELLRKWVLETCFPKELKALEIIKDRFTIQLEKINYLPNYYGIMKIGINPIYIKTREEYDLLKEVLL